MKIMWRTLCFFSPYLLWGQVGINTTEPKATLDVNGNLMIRQLDEVIDVSDHKVLLVNEVNSEVLKVDMSLISNSNSYVGNITKAKVSGSSVLLSANFYSGWDRVAHIPDPDFNTNFNTADSTYKIPSDGVYAIKYYYRFGNGVQLQLLSFGGSPKIGILKHGENGGYTILDQKEFSGASLNLSIIGLLSVLISSTNVDSVYKLKKDDVLSFEYFKGGISLDLLGNSTSEIQIYKISN